MRFARFVCLFVILICVLVLAQSRRAQFGNQPNGLPVALELQLGAPRVQQGEPFAQRQRTRDGAGALGGRSRRRNARRPAQTGPEQVLYVFLGGSDGGNPSSGLISDSSGNLYGMTANGGGGPCTNGCGTVFELSPNGSGGWTETILYSFQGGSDGQGPSSGLIFDQAGNLYGTTAQGGTEGGGGGTVFELSPNGRGGWTETILYSFLGGSDGGGPAGLIFDQKGNLYGPAGGGSFGCGHDGFAPCGIVFELSPNGNGLWTESLLYSFQGGGSDVWGPNPGLIFDQAGNLYGTTSQGGSYGGVCGYFDGCGTVFELSPNGNGGWTETLLYGFEGGSDGANSASGLVFDQAGNLYGTTERGGGTPCGGLGCGTVFELSPNGSGGWMETVLYSFQGTSDGARPDVGLIFDKNGNLYSTSSQGGGTACLNGLCGTVFELSPNGNGLWTESLLYSFQGGSDGEAPSGLIFDQSGNLYGTTFLGGGTGCAGYGSCGVVFEVSKEPFVAFSPASLSFGNQTVGISSSPQVATLTNSGNLPLTITSIQVIGANSSDFGQTNNCPSSLPPNNSCNISVTFTPTATGNRSAAVSVTDNGPGSPQSVPLTGVGVLPAVTFYPTRVTFPTQLVFTTSKTQPVKLTNTGAGILLITKISVTGPFSQTNNCPSSLNPNVTCTINVKFQPKMKGVQQSSVAVADNAPGSPQKVPLTGTGTFVQLVPTKLNFGTQPVGTRSLAKKITLTNKGSVTVNITKISITGADTADFAETNTCGKSVASGASCFIKVTFKPLGKGKRTAHVSVYDNGGGSPQQSMVIGTGT